MKKRKKIKTLANKKVIYFSLIMSMSFIGVGYAEWNDSLTIDLSIKTGFTCKNFDVGKYMSYDDGDLYFTVSDDGDKLIIKGKVYPTFNEDLTINLVDSGSLPSIIADIQDEDNDISTLLSSKGNEMTAFYNSKTVDSFNININPTINNDIINQLNAESFEYKDEVSSLEEAINLSNEISTYKTIEKRSFKYIISYEFEKNIWEKDLIIEGDIDVIPDPEVLSIMESRLVELQNKLNEKNEAQKVLEEQQRLLEQEQQKSLEQDNIEQDLQKNEKTDENDSNIVPETENTNIPESDEEVIPETGEELNGLGGNNAIDEFEHTDKTSDLTNTVEPGNEQQDISSEVNNEVENIEKEQESDEIIN